LSLERLWKFVSRKTLEICLWKDSEKPEHSISQKKMNTFFPYFIEKTLLLGEISRVFSGKVFFRVFPETIFQSLSGDNFPESFQRQISRVFPDQIFSETFYKNSLPV